MNNVIMNILNKPIFGDFTVLHAAVCIVVILMLWVAILEFLKFVKETQAESILDKKNPTRSATILMETPIERLSYTKKVKEDLRTLLTFYKFNKLNHAKYKVIFKMPIPSGLRWTSECQREIEDAEKILNRHMKCAYIRRRDKNLYLIFGCETIESKNKCLKLYNELAHNKVFIYPTETSKDTK